ncbi:hypothetical protein BpHYR1_002278 [Brachionus plicatilis]|uniref:Uncharacterized protein n=1 Tax=Brachionus plicatilis TaxID=10195 RepID=A0A3M7SJH5_BRAPC|nr:hypothetical protein BpHYR1_002278 [Brachionus plicatilis]
MPTCKQLEESIFSYDEKEQKQLTVVQTTKTRFVTKHPPFFRPHFEQNIKAVGVLRRGPAPPSLTNGHSLFQVSVRCRLNLFLLEKEDGSWCSHWLFGECFVPEKKKHCFVGSEVGLERFLALVDLSDLLKFYSGLLNANVDLDVYVDRVRAIEAMVGTVQSADWREKVKMKSCSQAYMSLLYETIT